MASQDFFSNTFVEHPLGSTGLYGVNYFGCNSIIKLDGDIWNFAHFESGNDIPYYTNRNGELRQVDLLKIRRDTPERITRMMIKDI